MLKGLAWFRSYRNVVSVIHNALFNTRAQVHIVSAIICGSALDGLLIYCSEPLVLFSWDTDRSSKRAEEDGGGQLKVLLVFK